MTSTEIIGVIGAVGILVGILSPAIISVFKAFTEMRVTVKGLEEKVMRVDTKADVIAAVAAKIDGHVNSEKTAGEGREHAKDVEIAILREMLSDKKQAASLLAQAAAGASTTVVHTTNGATKAGDEELKKNTADTAKNTAETAVNTKKTDAAVSELKEKL